MKNLFTKIALAGFLLASGCKTKNYIADNKDKRLEQSRNMDLENSLSTNISPQDLYQTAPYSMKVLIPESIDSKAINQDQSTNTNYSGKLIEPNFRLIPNR